MAQLRLSFEPTIEASNWWQWDHQTIQSRLSDFRSLEAFLEHL